MKKTKNIRIANRTLGKGYPVFVIAEIGSNHNRNLRLAKKLIREISTTGADAVKFQSFKADALVNKHILPDAYRLIRRNELPLKWLPVLKKYAEKKGLIFLSTPFDFEAAALLNRLRVPAFKIASGDITNIPLIKHVARFGKPMIVSVGASDAKLVRNMVEAIHEEGNNKIILCQCVVSYPAEIYDANLNVLDYLSNKFKTLVGYSDHSKTDLIPMIAVAKGAVVIEKHVTLSNSLKGPDHSFALTIERFKVMVDNIRLVEKILGDGNKKVLLSEKRSFFRARRSIYALTKLHKGDVVSADKLILLRPCVGLTPDKYEYVINKTVTREMDALEPVLRKYLVRGSQPI